MSAFKQFLASDVIVTPYTVNKSFTLYGYNELSASNVGIDTYIGRVESTLPEYWSETGTPSLTEGYPVYKPGVYYAINQLFYSNYSGSQYNASGSFINYEPSTINWSLGQALNQSQNQGIRRYFPRTASLLGSVIGVFTIPRKMYGNYIKPGSFRQEFTVNIYVDAISKSLADDGQGNLYMYPDAEWVGNMYYEQGLAVITNNTTVGNYEPGIYGSGKYGSIDIYGDAANIGVTLVESLFSRDSSILTSSFESATTMFQTQYKCTITPSEFVTTLNPTVFDGTGSVKPFATSSYFAPYITTVGLYNDNQELLAVAKLAQPIQSSTTTDTTILVNIDR